MLEQEEEKKQEWFTCETSLLLIRPSSPKNEKRFGTILLEMFLLCPPVWPWFSSSTRESERFHASKRPLNSRPRGHPSGIELPMLLWVTSHAFFTLMVKRVCHKNLCYYIPPNFTVDSNKFCFLRQWWVLFLLTVMGWWNFAWVFRIHHILEMWEMIPFVSHE